MAKRVFADTSYYIAIINRRDELHDVASMYLSRYPNVGVVTTDSVMIEVLAYFSKRGSDMRQLAVAAVDRNVANPTVTLIHQDEDLFFAGLDLYRARLDKGYSLTDCMSMIVCREQGITDILTHDRHFEQEGFAPLL